MRLVATCSALRCGSRLAKRPGAARLGLEADGVGESNPRDTCTPGGFQVRLLPSLGGPHSPVQYRFPGKSGPSSCAAYRPVPACHTWFVSKSVSRAWMTHTRARSGSGQLLVIRFRPRRGAEICSDLSNLGMILEFDGRPNQIGSSGAILGHPARARYFADGHRHRWRRLNDPLSILACPRNAAP